MKKSLIFLILFFIPLLLWAQADDFEPIDSSVEEWGNIDDENEESEEPAKETFRLKNRTVEFSIMNFSINASNDFVRYNDLFKDPFYMLFNIKNIENNPRLIWQDIVIDNIEDLMNGFRLNVNAVIKPFSFNINWKDQWGFGLDIATINATGNFLLSGHMLALNQVKGDTFGVGGAVFADVGVPLFFHVNDFKIKLRPAVYLPVIYTKPGMTYSFKPVTNDDGSEGMRMAVDLDMYIYSPVSLKGDIYNMLQNFQDDIWNILQNNLGYDFGLNVEYPWNYSLDIGVDIANVPVASAKLNHYLRYKGEVFFDTSNINLGSLLDEGDLNDVFKDAYDYPVDFNELSEYGYNSKGKQIYRPFTMLFYVNYRPFDSRIFSLIPALGFSINELYQNTGSLEGGLNVRLDLANIFITTLGTNYNDRIWKNSVDFILNLRAFELDFGLSTQSHNFIKSWQGAGVGVNFGMKFGW